MKVFNALTVFIIASMPNMVANVFFWADYEFLVYGDVRNLGCDNNTKIFVQVGFQQDKIIFNSTTIKCPNPEDIYRFSLSFTMYNQYKHRLYFEWRYNCTTNYYPKRQRIYQGYQPLEFSWSSEHDKYMCNVHTITIL